MFRSLDRFQRVQQGRLSDEAVAVMVKRRAKAVGLDPARYAVRSLRAGLATSAAAASSSERVIMSQTGHRSADTGRRHIREGSLFGTSTPAGLVGLFMLSRAVVRLPPSDGSGDTDARRVNLSMGGACTQSSTSTVVDT